MGDGDPATVKIRKELRKEKLMEYLTNKAKNVSKPNVSEHPRRKPETTRPSALQTVKGKENIAPVIRFRQETKKVKPLDPLNNKNPYRKVLSVANKEKLQSDCCRPAQVKKSTLTATYTVSSLKATSLLKKPPNVSTQPVGKTVSVAKSSKVTFNPPQVKTYSARLSLGPVVTTRTGLIPAMIRPRVTRPLPAADARVAPSRATVLSSNATLKKIPPQRPPVARVPQPVLVKQPLRKGRSESTVTATSLPDKADNRPLKPTVQNSRVVMSRMQKTARPKIVDTLTKKTSVPIGKQAPSRTAVTVKGQARLKTNLPTARTAEQEERMKKLQEWREAKGISYKRPSTLVKPTGRHTAPEPEPSCATLRSKNDSRSFICDVDSCLADCIKLLTKAHHQGCQAAEVRTILSRLPPISQKFAKFWVCQLRLMELEGNLDVLPIFEKAVRVTVEPVDEIRALVFEILKKKDTQAYVEDVTEIETLGSGGQTEVGEDKSETTFLITGETGTSSNVKYKITATPGPSTQQREPMLVDGHEVRFFTPVRRSVRIESTSRRYPAGLREHDPCVASFAELLDNEEEEEAAGRDTMYVYRENEALKDKVVVRVVTEEDA
ncbi:cytoskeleton-associated protein 2-like isoform X2 [Stigmatopora argus]